MTRSDRTLQNRDTVGIAHSMNLTVKKSCDQISILADIWNKTRQIVSYFRTSTTTKEKLTEVQQQMGKPLLKLINEGQLNVTVHVTCWHEWINKSKQCGYLWPH